MSPPAVGALVLAAGGARRMGGLQKLLQPVSGRPMLTWPVEAARLSGCHPVGVVVGHRAMEVSEVLPDGVQAIRNRRWSSGLASSLRSGLQHMPDDLDAVLVLLGDMPLIRADQCKAVLEQWKAGTIAVAAHGGRLGHPVVWCRRYLPALAKLTGDRGGRALMACHAHAVRAVPIDDVGVLMDVDTPRDLTALNSGPLLGPSGPVR